MAEDQLVSNANANLNGFNLFMLPITFISKNGLVCLTL